MIESAELISPGIPTGTSEMDDPIRALIRIIRGLPLPEVSTSQRLRTTLIKRLTQVHYQATAATRWTIRRNVDVPSRGTSDGYRGRISLICYPPGPPVALFERKALEPPILIEFGQLRAKGKSLTKLARYEADSGHEVTAKIIILRRQAQTSMWCDPRSYAQGVSNLWIVGLGTKGEIDPDSDPVRLDHLQTRQDRLQSFGRATPVDGPADPFNW